MRVDTLNVLTTKRVSIGEVILVPLPQPCRTLVGFAPEAAISELKNRS